MPSILSLQAQDLLRPSSTSYYDKPPSAKHNTTATVNAIMPSCPSNTGEGDGSQPALAMSSAMLPLERSRSTSTQSSATILLEPSQPASIQSSATWPLVPSQPSLTRPPTTLSSPSTSTQLSSTALSVSPAPSSSTSSSPRTAAQDLPDPLDGLDQEQLEQHQFDPLNGSQQQQVNQIYPPSHQAQNRHVYQQGDDGQMLPLPPLLHPSRQHQHPSKHQHPSQQQQQQQQQQPHDSSYCSSQPQPQQQPKSSFAAGPMVMQALDMARESPEAECDAKISALLNGALAEVVARLRAAPETYVMRRDEFSVFNFFQSRFDKRDELFMSARRRYWWFTTA